MLEKILELMKHYESVKSPYGEITLTLKSDLSGYFYFKDAEVALKFKSLEDAIDQWHITFKYKD